MKAKLLTTLSFFTYQVSISQTEKLLHGKVLSQEIALQNVEVINKTDKTSTRTNEMGEFSIVVRPKDSLIFFSKDYLFKRLKITSQDLETNNLVVKMVLKPEELKEVVISNIASKQVFLSKEDIKQIKLNSHKTKEGLKIQGFKEAKNGPLDMDFIYMGKQIWNLLKKDEEPKKEITKISFKQLIKTTIDPHFFTKDLKLKPDEEALFLEFCDADPNSQSLLEHPNVLATLDFLYTKNDAFKKLNSGSKN